MKNVHEKSKINHCYGRGGVIKFTFSKVPQQEKGKNKLFEGLKIITTGLIYPSQMKLTRMNNKEPRTGSDFHINI